MSPNRKELETYGRKGKRGYVRVFRELVGHREMVRVQWREPGVGLKTDSFDDTRKGIAEAKAFALGKHEALLDQPKIGAPTVTFDAITLRQLRDMYFAAHANDWEPATVYNKAARWKVLELVLGRDTVVAALDPERLDEAVNALLTTAVKRVHKKRSANQVRMTIATLCAAYRWGVARNKLPPSLVMTYRPKLKQALKKQVIETGEYSADERARLVAALDPRSPGEWRAWALSVLFAHCGPRQRAARYLEISDIELSPVAWVDGQPVLGGSIRWRAETDKMDNERQQPMPPAVAEAFWIALGWRAFDEYTGAFLFYGAQRRTRGQALRRNTRRAKSREELAGLEIEEKPYTYAALNASILRAEVRAGIEHKAYRSTHGHRRGVSGDIHATTGSSKKAADWIGDKSTKVVEKHYLLQRQETLDEASSIVSDKLVKAQNDAANTRAKADARPSEELRGARAEDREAETGAMPVSGKRRLQRTDRGTSPQGLRPGELGGRGVVLPQAPRPESPSNVGETAMKNATERNTEPTSPETTNPSQLSPYAATDLSEPAVGIEPTTAQSSKRSNWPLSSNSSGDANVATIPPERTANRPHPSAIKRNKASEKSGPVGGGEGGAL